MKVVIHGGPGGVERGGAPVSVGASIFERTGGNGNVNGNGKRVEKIEETFLDGLPLPTLDVLACYHFIHDDS